VAVRAFRTEVRFDWGTLVHFVYGLLSGWLGPWQSLLAAAIFLFKQAVDGGAARGLRRRRAMLPSSLSARVEF
jgi:hypothetical protein